MDNSLPLTRTKIIVPRRREGLLSRQRLLDLIYGLLENKLTIVAAPAGYGKTSLLIDFIHFTGWPACWLSLDPLDQDPQRFLSHFIAAINLRFPRFGKISHAALQSSFQDRLNLDSIVSIIANDLYENITEHFVFILDDYHLVESSSTVNQFINQFLQSIDENCHLVIASRTLLTLPDLPLLVARSQVGGLSFEELAFQPQEIQELMLQNHRLVLSDQQAKEMANSTEGWITGLLLSTQIMGGELSEKIRINRVPGIGLYEYLAQQVLDHQSSEIQDFLLRTSLLEEFDAGLCEETIGRALGWDVNWRELMDSVLQRNLFVLPVGEEGSFLRYHHLFRDFLQDRILNSRPVEAGKIRKELAAVYARRGEWEHAYELFKLLGSQNDLLELIESAGPALMGQGRMVTLNNWLDAIPAKTLTSYPALISLQGAVAVNRGDTARGLKLLNEAVNTLRSSGNYYQLGLTLIRRTVANRLIGNYAASQHDAEEAISLWEKDPSLQVLQADGLYGKGMSLYYQGRLSEALPVFQQAIQAYENINDQQSIAIVLLNVGLVYKISGQYSAAKNTYARALEYYQKAGNLLWQANLLNNLGVLQDLLGEYEAALLSLEKAVEYAAIAGYPRMKAYALASIGDLYRDMDAANEAEEAYGQAYALARQVNERFLVFYLALMEGVIAWAAGKDGRAGEWFAEARGLLETSASQYEKHLFHLEQAGINCMAGKFGEVIASLAESIHFFERENYAVELIRAHLYLAIAHFQSGEAQAAGAHFARLADVQRQPENIHILVVSASEFINRLEKIKTAGEQYSWIAALLGEISRFEERLPSLRRSLRRRVAAIPLGMPRLVIRTLGKMQVKISGHAVTSADWQTQTARDLFFLLLAHPEGLSKEAIGEIFWPDSSPLELKLRFKNTIYRLRHALGKDVVMFSDETYFFNRALDYDEDIETFLREVNQAETAVNPEQKIAHYLAVVKIYKGIYLPDLDGTWVLMERERYYQFFMGALLKLAGLYIERNQYEAALNFCQRALREDRCQEDAYRLAMRSYAALGNRAALIRQFELCKQALLQELGTTPSEKTQTLFEQLNR